MSALPGCRGDLAALVAGAAWPLAFAPFGWFPVSVLSLAVLFWLLEGHSPWPAFRRAYAFGLGQFTAGTWWVFISIHQFGGTHWSIALFITALMIVALALFPAVAASLAVRLYPEAGMRRWLLGLPAAWVLLEWVRSWFMTGFPWLSAGYAHTDSWLAGWAPAGGVFLVSLAAAVSAGAVLAVFSDRRPHTALIGGTLVAAAWLGGAGLKQVEWHVPDGEPVSVALLQGNVAQELKWVPDQLVPTIRVYHDLTADNWDADIVVWPEAALPALRHQVDDYLEALADIADDHGSVVVMGMLTRDGDDIYNSVITLGRGEGIYHKRHLVPFGEYFPVPRIVRDWLRMMNLPYSDFSRGDRVQPPLEAHGVKLAASVCYEAAFGDEISRPLPGAGMLVNVSNDAWFGDSIAPHQHLQIARMRTQENARWMLRATNTGITALIGPDGRVRAQLPQFEAGVLRGEVPPLAGTAPYVVVGNWLVTVLVFMMLIAGSRRTASLLRTDKRL